jgi:hypothetical protein
MRVLIRLFARGFGFVVLGLVIILGYELVIGVILPDALRLPAPEWKAYCENPSILAGVGLMIFGGLQIVRNYSSER